MEKYYIIKKFKTNVKNEINETIFFEKNLTLYDTFSEACGKVVKRIINNLEDDDYIIDMPIEEIYAQFLKKNFDFKYTVTTKEDRRETIHYVKKLKNGIYERIENNILFESETIIEKIDTSNVLYAIMNGEIADDKMKGFKFGIFDDCEDMSACLSNYETFKRLDGEAIEYLQGCILNKEKIYNDEYICEEMVKIGFLNGYDRNASNTLSYFNPELISKFSLLVRYDVIKQRNKMKERIKYLEKENKKLKNNIEELHDKINEKDDILERIQNILK